MLPFLPSPYSSVPKRDRVITTICGDDVAFTVIANIYGEPANPDNSIVRASLSDTKFSPLPWWQGGWHCGAELISNGTVGLVKITIPHSVSDNLRQGSYSLSVSVSDKLGCTSTTVATGSLNVEYSGTSPHKSVPYNDGTWANATSNNPALVYRVVDIDGGAVDVDLSIPEGYALASAPLLINPDKQVQVWLTDVTRTVLGVKASFGAMVPSSGWTVSFVLFRINQ